MRFETQEQALEHARSIGFGPDRVEWMEPRSRTEQICDNEAIASQLPPHVVEAINASSWARGRDLANTIGCLEGDVDDYGESGLPDGLSMRDFRLAQAARRNAWRDVTEEVPGYWYAPDINPNQHRDDSEHGAGFDWRND